MINNFIDFKFSACQTEICTEFNGNVSVNGNFMKYFNKKLICFHEKIYNSNFKVHFSERFGFYLHGFNPIPEGGDQLSKEYDFEEFEEDEAKHKNKELRELPSNSLS